MKEYILKINFQFYSVQSLYLSYIYIIKKKNYEIKKKLKKKKIKITYALSDFFCNIVVTFSAVPKIPASIAYSSSIKSNSVNSSVLICLVSRY